MRKLTELFVVGLDSLMLSFDWLIAPKLSRYSFYIICSFETRLKEAFKLQVFRGILQGRLREKYSL